MFSLHDLGWECHTVILMCLRKLGRYLCILGTVKWMNDVLWLDIRCLQVAEIEEWLKETCSCTTWEEKWSCKAELVQVNIWSETLEIESTEDAVVCGRFFSMPVLDYCPVVAVEMAASQWWHETQVPIIWSFKNSGFHFKSPEAVNMEPGWVSTTVITACQCRFCLPLKSLQLFFTSFAKLLCPPCCCWWW